MQRNLPITVVVPKPYLSNNQKYPVVYLLHGFGDKHSMWSEKYDLKAATNKYNVIIVCPDGQNSWYLDSPIDNKMQFETFISSELISYIDSHYRTRANRDGRAITGQSMGGHGALWNAFRHPDVFANCGSMSGGVDLTDCPDRFTIDKRLGKYADNKQLWIKHSVIGLVPQLKPGKQNIIIDDGAQDFFFKINMNLHDALVKAGIEHDFCIRPGQHSWKYWQESLPNHLDFFCKAFNGEPIVCKTAINAGNKKEK